MNDKNPIVTIATVPVIKTDDRGVSYGLDVRDTRYIVVLQRKKGSISGKHYHTGLFTSKNPEIFYLANGTIRLVVRDMSSGIIQEFLIEENTKIEIPAMVYHEVHALTDITLIEFNSENNDFKTDTVKLSGNF